MFCLFYIDQRRFRFFAQLYERTKIIEMYMFIFLNGFCTYTRICVVFLSSYFYFSRFALTMLEYSFLSPFFIRIPKQNER
jgi:hypothetical protein